MTWTKYDLCFQLLSPLHIGYRQVGNLQQTRGYIPGKVMWAALTARLTREKTDRTGKDYKTIGEAVKNNFCFSYFYPALADKKPCYPWADEEIFAYRFLDSYASTALNYTSFSAEEGLLHETEFIAPHTRPTRNKESEPVYLVGCTHVKDEANLDENLSAWKAALPKLQFGGERGYGWGRVALANISEGQLADPKITLSEGNCTTAHAQAQNDQLQGEIEPLVGWERNNTGQGSRWRLTPNVQVYYVPGSKVTQTTTFTIGNNGILAA